MLELHPEADGKILTVMMSGKLTKDDYRVFVPEVERLIAEHGKLRVLCEMHDFHGWEMGALWEDIKFEWKHFADIERLALVGQQKWQAGMAAFCKPFTSAKVRYFDEHQTDQAIEWMWEGMSADAMRLARQAHGGGYAHSAGYDVVQEASEESFPASDAPGY